MTGKQDPVIPGEYRQHILAAVIITGNQPVSIDTHGGGPGATGSHITATFGEQLMITLYDMAAANTYGKAWLSDDKQWVFDGLPLEVPVVHGRGSIGPALSIRARGGDERAARYDSASRTAIIRVGSLTWTVQDQLAANSMRNAWRHIAKLGPIILSRQVPTPRRRST